MRGALGALTGIGGRIGRLLLSAALVALFLFTGLGAPPATAAPTEDEDAEAVVPLGGSPIEPGYSAARPLDLASGVYVTGFPAAGRPDFVRYERKWPGSRIYFGVNVADGSRVPSVFLSLFADGRFSERCSDFAATAQAPSHKIQGDVASALVNDRKSKACQKADSLVLRTNTLFSPSVPSGSYQITVWEEPPVENADELPEPGELSWRGEFAGVAPTAVKPGTSPVNAPLLTDGSWSTTIERGEVPWFRIEAGWGEHIEVQVETDGAQGADDKYYDSLAPRWIGPNGGGRPATYDPPGTPGSFLSINDPGKAYTGIPAVTWKNNTAGDYFEGYEPFLPGPWFLAFISEELPKKPLEITLKVAVVEDYQPILPKYAHTPDPLPAMDGRLYSVPTADDPEPAAPVVMSAGGTQAVELPDRSTVPWPAVVMLLGAATVSTAAGLLLLSRARRPGGRASTGR